MINLITTFYISNYKSSLDKQRTEELVAALQNNINSTFIKSIHLYVDNKESLDYLNTITKSDKIVVIETGKKPTYDDFFNYILKKLKSSICMIANSDIYLAECDMNILDKVSKSRICYALTRHEFDMSCRLITNYCGSHDCYIFNSHFLHRNILTHHTKYVQNLPGIESQIIKNFCDHGFKVFNPCYQIKIVHLHRSNLRKYSKNDWIGLHKYGDMVHHKSTCWWVPPIKM